MEPGNRRQSFAYEDLLECAHGRLFGPGNAQLPLPPMLMFERIPRINDDGGAHGRGEAHAELDIDPGLWFFACHFEGDPVMPGCLGLDSLWQLLGFWMGWTGAPGAGRALGVGAVKLTGQVQPDTRLVSYHVEVRQIVNRKLVLGIADGVMRADGEVVYTAEGLKVGLFAAAPRF